MSYNRENIRTAAKEIAEKHNLLLIDLVIRGSEASGVIEVYIDGESNVSADDCANVSRELNKKIEEGEFVKGNYRLDVSSPGVNRPLVYLKQFPKHISRKFELEYKSGDTTQSINGKLITVEDNVLTFWDKTEIKIKFEDIIKAKVLVSFN